MKQWVPIAWPYPGSHTKVERQPGQKLRHPEKGLLVEIGHNLNPDHTWSCGTDVVWVATRLKYPDGQVIDLAFGTCACRHQIDVGD